MEDCFRTLILVASLQANQAIFDAWVTRRTASRAALPYILLAIVSGLYLYPFMRAWPGSCDEGTYLYGAQLAAHGAIPGRDFMELNAPGAFYWLAMFFRIFGTSMLTARTVLLLTGVGTALLVFHLSRRIGASGIFAAVFVVSTSIPMMTMNSPHYDTNLFGLLALATFLSAEQRLTGERSSRSGRALLFSAGLLTGIVSCIIQQKGMYFAAAFILSLMILHGRNRFRFAVILLAGYCCPIATELILYAAAKALPDLIYANLILPLSTYTHFNAIPYGFPVGQGWQSAWLAVKQGSFPSAFEIAENTALVLPWVLVPLFPLLAILGCCWRKQAFRRELLPYWLTGYALWVSESHRPDIGHLRNGCLILVILFFALCEMHKKPYPKYWALLVTACVLMNAAIKFNMVSASSKVVVPSRRGSLLAEQPDTALQFLLSHTEPGENVFIYPYRAIYYFLADVHNPTRFSALMYDPSTTFLFGEAVRDIESKKVRYVLWDTIFAGEGFRSIFPAYNPPPPNELIMEPYLETHYHQIGFENGFRILERTQ